MRKKRGYLIHQALIIVLLYFNQIASFDSEEEVKNSQTTVGLKTVMEEKLKVLRGESQSVDFEGLKIIGLRKTYNIANKCCGSKSVHALKEVPIV